MKVYRTILLCWLVSLATLLSAKIPGDTTDIRLKTTVAKDQSPKNIKSVPASNQSFKPGSKKIIIDKERNKLVVDSAFLKKNNKNSH